MKAKIHPKVNNKVKVTCNCGNTFFTSSVLNEIQVEICGNCHPFYTGVEKLVDTEGRVDKFKKKQDVAKKRQAEIKKVEVAKQKKVSNQERPLSLKDLLKSRESK